MGRLVLVHEVTPTRFNQNSVFEGERCGVLQVRKLSQKIIMGSTATLSQNRSHTNIHLVLVARTGFICFPYLSGPPGMPRVADVLLSSFFPAFKSRDGYAEVFMTPDGEEVSLSQDATRTRAQSFLYLVKRSCGPYMLVLV